MCWGVMGGLGHGGLKGICPKGTATQFLLIVSMWEYELSLARSFEVSWKAGYLDFYVKPLDFLNDVKFSVKQLCSKKVLYVISQGNGN